MLGIKIKINVSLAFTHMPPPLLAQSDNDALGILESLTETHFTGILIQPRPASVFGLLVESTFFKNVTYMLFLGGPRDLLGGLKVAALQLEWHHGTGGWGGLRLKCQRTKVLPFKTSWHFHQGQALLSVSEREDGKREAGLDILASVLISSCICVLPVVHDTVCICFVSVG